LSIKIYYYFPFCSLGLVLWKYFTKGWVPLNEPVGFVQGFIEAGCPSCRSADSIEALKVEPSDYHCDVIYSCPAIPLVTGEFCFCCVRHSFSSI